jgi:hypothetical protein
METMIGMTRVTMTLIEIQGHHTPLDRTGCNEAMVVEATEDHLMAEMVMKEKTLLEDPCESHTTDIQCLPQNKLGYIPLAYRQQSNTIATKCTLGSYDCAGITYLTGCDHQKGWRHGGLITPPLESTVDLLTSQS